MIPLILLILLLSFGGFALISVQRAWRNQTELQLGLDRCVREKALSLKALLEQFRASNRKINQLRQAIRIANQAAPVSGVGSAASAASRIALQSLLRITQLNQDRQRMQWEVSRSQLILGGSCEKIHSLKIKIPRLGLKRDLPDEIGPQPLEWEQGETPRYFIQFRKPPRASAAVVSARGELFDEEMLKERSLEVDWRADWTAPIGAGSR